jgi:shikimate dehydrogenase
MKSHHLDQYCVFGNPISQSRSPFIHHQFASSTNQKLNYQAKFVEKEGFSLAIKEFISQGGKGANVTAPFKEQAVTISDHLTERARLAGAVNTITIKNGELYGDNTDGEGLVQDLIRHNIRLNNSRILLLGAGGASKGVILPLLGQKPQSITVANRTLSKADSLCEKFNNNKLNSCEISASAERPFDIIINATSASLSGKLPDLSASIISKNTACYDMVYGKEQTPFLLWAKDNGANQLFDGLGMLVGQAAESFNLWRGVKPDVSAVIELLKISLNTE